MQKYYKILDLPYDAPLSDVKQAYRDLVHVWHPDRFPGNERLQRMGTEKLMQINEAYRMLCSLTKEIPPEPDNTEVFSEAELIDWQPRTKVADNCIPSDTTSHRKSFFPWRHHAGLSVLGYLFLFGWLVSSIAVEAQQKAPSRIAHTYATDSANALLQRCLGFRDLPDKQFFTIGSTKDDVLSLQGTPTEEIWKYGESKVVFENGYVKHWVQTPSRSLHADTSVSR